MKVDKELKTALHEAGLTELPDEALDGVVGGACKAGCMNSCSSCSTCSPGNSPGGGGGGDVFEPTP